MRKRLISATVVGASALTLGAGLFAWQATSVTINGVESAGAADQTLGCLIGDLSLAHNDPIYDTALNEWFITGINVTGDAGSDATACEGYDLKVSYETLAGATIQVGTVEDLPDDAAFAQALAVVDGVLPGVPSENIKNWQIVIGGVQEAVILYTPASFGGTTPVNEWHSGSSPYWTSTYKYMQINSLYGGGTYKFYSSVSANGLTYKGLTPEGGISYGFSAGGPAEMFWYHFASNPDLGSGAALIPIPAP